MALLLSIAVLAAVFAGCGNNAGEDKSSSAPSSESSALDDSSADSAPQDEASSDEEAPAEPGELTLPLCEEKEEHSVWLQYSGAVISDINQVAGIQKMEELTNVHISWIPVGLQEIGDKYGVMPFLWQLS